MPATAGDDEGAVFAGMSLERVMRFAAAVMDERIRIADEARRSRARRTVTDGEGKLLVFGEAVDERFRAHGIDPDSVSWDARPRWCSMRSQASGPSCAQLMRMQSMPAMTRSRGYG